ncbi:MAG: hypothetical protein ACRDX8_00170 [Acidimicrobiales bacterium]
MTDGSRGRTSSGVVTPTIGWYQPDAYSTGREVLRTTDGGKAWSPVMVPGVS